MVDMHKGQYRRPRAINIVSIGLVLLALIGAYWLYCFGPAYLSRYRVKEVIREAASRYYKLSFLEETLKAEETNKLAAETRQKVVEILGFDDEEMTIQVLINEDTKAVNVVADYNYPVVLPGLNKTRIVHFNIVAETDYVNTGN